MAPWNARGAWTLVGGALIGIIPALAVLACSCAIRKTESHPDWSRRVKGRVANVMLVTGWLVLALGSALGLRLFLLRLVVGNDTEVVVGKLQVVFGLHPVVVQRRFVRQLLVLFQQLRGIATRAGIDPVGLVATTAATVATAAATTIAVSIAVQGKFASSIWLRFKSLRHMTPREYTSFARYFFSVVCMLAMRPWDRGTGKFRSSVQRPCAVDLCMELATLFVFAKC